MEDMRRQPSCSCSIRSFLDNLRPAFSVSQQFQDFQSGCFGAEWAVFDKLVEDICDCYRQKNERKEAMTIATGACGSQLTRSLEEMFSPVVPASNRHPVQERLLVTSTQYFIDVSGSRPRVPLCWTLLVTSEEALDCVIENTSEPVVSVFQGALQLDPLCLKASNQYSVVLLIPRVLTEAVLLPRFSYLLSSHLTQMQRESCKRKPLRFVQWPEDVEYCGYLSRSSGTALSATEEQEAQNRRWMLRTIDHPVSGQMSRKILETMAFAESCIELLFFSDISREDPEHPHLLSE